jgi:SAM-dependent methyltransferase
MSRRRSARGGPVRGRCHGARPRHVRVGAVEDLAESGFDFAYARMLLMHVHDPTRVAELMFAALRPGGIVAVEDELLGIVHVSLVSGL